MHPILGADPRKLEACLPDLLPNITNETWTASRIHGSTGWTTYSVLTKEVTAENTKNIEETTIQLK